MSTALELSKEAFRCGYVKPEDREGPPSPESKMSAWQQDMDQWRQSEELWSAFADKAIAAVARLEDLRRWRPMSEHPNDARPVLVQHPIRGILEIHAQFINGIWRGMDFAGRLGDYLWTYIPGQEPKEEV